MTDHHIKLTLQRNGYGVSAEFTCTAGPDADCRNHCTECDPEYGCSEYAEHRPNWVPSNCCNPTEFIGNDDADWYDLYGGTTDTELRSGPITLKWEGDHYTWDYAEAPTGQISTAAAVRQIDATIAERDRLREALRDIAELHSPVKLRGDDRSVCADCGGFYPCPTAALIPDAATIKSELIVHGDGGLTKRFIETIHKLSDWAGVDISELIEQGYLKEGDLGDADAAATECTECTTCQAESKGMRVDALTPEADQ